ncbi:MAG: hypothetical protein JNJ55_13300, partial [Betaproteobacteria bacterium]|nr:hypothetical protein [Betaproteobacteria bacterium]
AADAVSRAVEASAGPNSLSALRKDLRARVAASALCDVPRFVANLEAAYRTAWKAWCESKTRNHALVNTRAHIDAHQTGDALAAAADLCRREPNWELAKIELVRAALAWGAAHPEVKPLWHQPFERAPRQRVSVIACSIRHDYFAALQNGIARQFAAHEVELIGIHDAKSLCEGFNRGAAQAKGDVLVFCHDDIAFPQADFGERVLAQLGTVDVVGLAGATQLVNGDWRHAGAPHLVGQILHQPPAGQVGFLYHVVGLHNAGAPLQALDGVWLAMNRRVWEAVRFDEETFDGFHLYDIDFTFRAARAGFKLAAPGDLLLTHFSTGRYDAAWQRYNRRFLAKYPALSNQPSARRHGAIHVKLQTLEQVDRVHAALAHVGFGALSPDQTSS